MLALIYWPTVCFFLSSSMASSFCLSFNFEIFPNATLPICHIFTWESSVCYDGSDYICGLSLDDALEIVPNFVIVPICCMS